MKTNVKKQELEEEQILKFLEKPIKSAILFEVREKLQNKESLTTEEKKIVVEIIREMINEQQKELEKMSSHKIKLSIETILSFDKMTRLSLSRKQLGKEIIRAKEVCQEVRRGLYLTSWDLLEENIDILLKQYDLLNNHKNKLNDFKNSFENSEKAIDIFEAQTKLIASSKEISGLSKKYIVKKQIKKES